MRDNSGTGTMVDIPSRTIATCTQGGREGERKGGREGGREGEGREKEREGGREGRRKREGVREGERKRRNPPWDNLRTQFIIRHSFEL